MCQVSLSIRLQSSIIVPVGCCLFFRGKLIYSHLSVNNTRQIFQFCAFQDLLPGDQNTFLLQQVFPGDISSDSQHYLLVCTEEMLTLCLLVQGENIRQSTCCFVRTNFCQQQFHLQTSHATCASPSGTIK